MNFWEINFPLKMKSLEQELAKSKAKLEKISSTKLAVDNKSVYVPL